MDNPTFIFEEQEVRLTGRKAVKEIKVLPGHPPRELHLVEITPVDTLYDWKKWVSPEHLYKVVTED